MRRLVSEVPTGRSTASVSVSRFTFINREDARYTDREAFQGGRSFRI